MDSGRRKGMEGLGVKINLLGKTNIILALKLENC